jgi:hypothetical protein
MATIRVKRGSAWISFLRSYSVLLDQKRVGALRRDEEIVLEISAGAHTLQMQIDWVCGAPLAFSIADTDTLAFECGTSGGFATLLAILTQSNYEDLQLRHVERSEQVG